MKVRSIITEDNFKNMLLASLASAKVAESPTIAANSWAWNDTYKAAHINDASASLKGVAEINLGFIKAGDEIRLSSEFFNVSGTRAKMYLDVYDNDIYTTGLSNAVIYQSSKTGEFEENTIAFIARKDGYYKAGFGLVTADIGEFYMRNCFVEIDSVVDVKTTNYKQATKIGNIKTSATGLFERDTRFGVEDFTVSVNTSYLVVAFSAPFSYSDARPVVMIGEDSTGNAYKVKTTAQQVAGFTVQLFNASTGALVDHTQIPAGVYFSFMAIGYDLI